MGDHRLAVEITLVGRDGKKRQIDWWVNWTDKRPAEVYQALVELADKSQLDVDTSEIWEGYDSEELFRRDV